MQTLQVEDARRKRILNKTSHRGRQLLPGCNTLVKQLFAGFMGLSIMASEAGYQVGQPLDIETNYWDANSREGAR